MTKYRWELGLEKWEAENLDREIDKEPFWVDGEFDEDAYYKMMRDREKKRN